MNRSIWCMLGIAMFASTAAHGGILSAQSSPSSVPVEVTRSTNVSIGWLIKADTGVTMYSARGEFVAPDGSMLGANDTVVNLALGGAGDSIFVESLVVPANLVTRAHLTGNSSFVYRRKFSDGRSEIVGNLTLHVAAAGSSMRFANTNPGASTDSFDVYRLALGFEGGAPLANVSVNGTLTVQGKIGYSVGGIIDAGWEVAGPNSTEYRTLAPVKQFLDPSGEVVLQSPPLPTAAPGVYSVRLQVTTPAPQMEEPEIRYVVVGN